MVSRATANANATTNATTVLMQLLMQMHSNANIIMPMLGLKSRGTSTGQCIVYSVLSVQ